MLVVQYYKRNVGTDFLSYNNEQEIADQCEAEFKKDDEIVTYEQVKLGNGTTEYRLKDKEGVLKYKFKIQKS